MSIALYAHSAKTIQFQPGSYVNGKLSAGSVISCAHHSILCLTGRVCTIIIFLAALHAVLSGSPVSAADAPDSIEVAFSTDSCFPEVRIHTVPVPVSVCLNSMNADNDSCVAVTIDGRDIFGVKLHFFCSHDRIWSYTGMDGAGSSGTAPVAGIKLVNDLQGNLTLAHVFPAGTGDSLTILTELRIENDRVAAPDEKANVNIGINRMVYHCLPDEPHDVVGQYMYNFPLGYRRDPVLNYPELSMFHCGKSVRMPTWASLEHRAQLYLYWHCHQLAELKFDNPDEIERSFSAVNRLSRKKEQSVKKKKKKPFISFRPLR